MDDKALPVITITVNPAIDVSAHISVLKPDKKLHCTEFKKEPGGGGINVSRAIRRFGGNSTAVYFAGGYTGYFLASLLHQEQVATIRIGTVNHTRENFVVKEDATGLQYRFGMPGPLINESEWQKCLLYLSSTIEPEYMVASGSLSEGVPPDFFARIAKIAKYKNARFVLDTSGEPLREALAEGLYMIKPNLGELAHLAGEKELDKETAILAAQDIIAKKQCEVVVVSMAAAGALLVTQSIAEHIVAPVVKQRSSVGAGDSMVAGIVWSLVQNRPLTECVRFGVACGSAATINEGSALCNHDDAARLFKLVNNHC